MKFVELSEAEFRKFEQKNRYGNFFQGVERARLRKDMGWGVWLLGVKEEGKVVGGGMLMAKNGEGLVQLGPILDWDNANLVKFWVEGAKKFAQKQGLVCLEIFPPALLSVRDAKGEVIEKFERGEVMGVFAELGFKHMGMTVKLENKANRWMVVKDLSGMSNMDEVRGSYKKNVRNKLRKIAPELEVYELREKSEIPLLTAVVDASNDKNGVVSRDAGYYEGIWDVWGKDARWVVARRKEGGEVVSGRILFYHPNEVVSFISGTAREWRQLNGMTFLQDWLMEDSLKRGVSRVNLYGIDGDFSGKNPLLEFKSGFGVVVEEYVGGFRCVLNPMKYRAGKMNRAARGMARKIIRG
ncbi:MAG: aminoacyltransferase [Candidatus Nomurabacteria bacterium]|jgi:lipid II:glycine glycyltransferase (peptidoglycan interpeptide bridge formation enzyme)|nr:aminoacyltransferase [Candidatus Nomurabacteria bacterium]